MDMTTNEGKMGAEHPPAYRLEGFAAGRPDPEIDGHLGSCPRCRRQVTALRDGAEAFRAAADPDAFIARASAALERRVAPQVHRPGRWIRASWLTAPIAAAAAFWLIARVSVPPRPAGAEAGGRTTANAGTRFKGGLSVVVIRDRNGAQQRITGPFAVRAGDRIRIEFGLDAPRSLTAGLLDADGQWLTLVAPAIQSPGTHDSETAASFDGAATSAWLLVGPPEQVERARRTHEFEGLLAWRIESER